MVVFALDWPPAPLHVRVYELVSVGVTILFPLIAIDVLPHAPDVEQLVVLVELHAIVLLAPLVIDTGLAVILMVGAGVLTGGVTVMVALADAEPPLPVQVSV